MPGLRLYDDKLVIQTRLFSYMLVILLNRKIDGGEIGTEPSSSDSQGVFTADEENIHKKVPIVLIMTL